MGNLEVGMENLAGKNVLVTGGCGLAGSHLVEELLGLKANPIVLYRSINPKSYFSHKKFSSKVILAQGDIKDKNRIFDIITKYETDYIFHLAAQPVVPIAYYNPIEALESNIMGTVNVLEGARLWGKTKGIVVASSDKAYGKSEKKYTEADPLRGDHPYDVSKSCADLIAITYYKTYSLPVTVGRFGNTYGPGDLNFSRIIPGIVRSLIKNEELEIRSDGTFVRDYIYVKDVAKAYLLLAKNIEKTKGEAFNVSSDDSLSVIDLIRKIEKSLKMKVRYKILNTAKNEIPYQSLSCKKINKLLGWKPKYNLENSIKETFNWYKNFYFL